jgi:hypothetical protein
MPQSRNNDSDLARIAKLEAELESLARQPARSSAEGTEIAYRVSELRRIIEYIRSGQANWGHP